MGYQVIVPPSRLSFHKFNCFLIFDFKVCEGLAANGIKAVGKSAVRRYGCDLTDLRDDELRAPIGRYLRNTGELDQIDLVGGLFEKTVRPTPCEVTASAI